MNETFGGCAESAFFVEITTLVCRHIKSILYTKCFLHELKPTGGVRGVKSKAVLVLFYI